MNESNTYRVLYLPSWTVGHVPVVTWRNSVQTFIDRTMKITYKKDNKKSTRRINRCHDNDDDDDNNDANDSNNNNQNGMTHPTDSFFYSRLTRDVSLAEVCYVRPCVGVSFLILAKQQQPCCAHIPPLDLLINGVVPYMFDPSTAAVTTFLRSVLAQRPTPSKTKMAKPQKKKKKDVNEVHHHHHHHHMNDSSFDAVAWDGGGCYNTSCGLVEDADAASRILTRWDAMLSREASQHNNSNIIRAVWINMTRRAHGSIAGYNPLKSLFHCHSDDGAGLEDVALVWSHSSLTDLVKNAFAMLNEDVTFRRLSLCGDASDDNFYINLSNTPQLLSLCGRGWFPTLSWTLSQWCGHGAVASLNSITFTDVVSARAIGTLNALLWIHLPLVAPNVSHVSLASCGMIEHTSSGPGHECLLHVPCLADLPVSLASLRVLNCRFVDIIFPSNVVEPEDVMTNNAVIYNMEFVGCSFWSADWASQFFVRTKRPITCLCIARCSSPSSSSSSSSGAVISQFVQTVSTGTKSLTLRGMVHLFPEGKYVDNKTVTFPSFVVPSNPNLVRLDLSDSGAPVCDVMTAAISCPWLFVSMEVLLLDGCPWSSSLRSSCTTLPTNATGRQKLNLRILSLSRVQARASDHADDAVHNVLSDFFDVCCGHLVELNLSGSGGLVMHWSPLCVDHLPHVRILDLSDVTTFCDENAFAKTLSPLLTHLSVCNVSGITASSLFPLLSLTSSSRLRSIDVRGTQISRKQLSRWVQENQAALSDLVDIFFERDMVAHSERDDVISKELRISHRPQDIVLSSKSIPK
eukprot:PhM_4_TR5000/c0_g1_i1/m.12811